MHAAVAKILQSPNALTIAQELQQAVTDEAKRRHAFREWLDEDKKAEFINGEVVIMHSPVKKRHSRVSKLLTRLAGVYAEIKGIGEIMYEKALIALTRNDYEPDMVFYRKEEADKQTDDQMIFPAPSFVVEILSKSTAKYDKGIKKQDYAAHGIEEYWIIDPVKQQIEQYLLIGNGSEYMPPYVFLYEDNIESAVITGFNIPVAALFDEAINLQTLKQLMGK
ncbi:MAG: Uma2 family endonuclease [Saprospiraceae bacterium]|nr:Uma2 family endonuclease [Saprospiraceae bacterium]